jgi:hypothetical protein
MPLPRKPSQATIVASVQALIRSFPSEAVTITRVTGYTRTAGRTLGVPVVLTVYRGEALVVPAGGTYQVLGLGPYKTDTPRLLIAGQNVIRTGDLTTIHGRDYVVDAQPNYWGAFNIVTLKQLDNGG